MSHVTCHPMSHVTCDMSSFICHITPLLLNCQSHISEFFGNVNHSQCVMFHMSSVRFHVSCVMCYVSGGMCHSGFFHLFTPFKRFFPPTSRSLMSKLFGLSESLGKSNLEKWSQIWIFIAHKGCKIVAQFCLTSRVFFGIGATIRIGLEMLCL